MTKYNLALALGGGGARGLAHIGALKVLEKEKIGIDLIVGTSMGAMVGAAYAQTSDAMEVERRFIRFVNSEQYSNTGLDLFKRRAEVAPENFWGHLARSVKERVVINFVASRKSIANEDRLKIPILAILEECSIENTKIPFACVATDLISGNEYVFTSGDIRLAVQASSSVPGFLPPVPFGNMLLTDGAVSWPIPIRQCYELGAKNVLVCDVTQILDTEDKFDNVIDVVYRANQITEIRYARRDIRQSNLVIKPLVGNYHWSDFKQCAEIIQAGEEATYQKLKEIRSLTREKVSFWKRIFTTE